MKEYKGRKILKQISARLVPSNNTLPDCICEILLTQDTLYVLEDDFNGAYTTHYAIPCSHIVSMEKYIDDEQPQGNPSDQNYARNALIGLLGGVLVLPGPKRSSHSPGTDYLRIIFKDGSKEETVFFSEVSGSIRAFSKVFLSLNKPH